MQTDTWPAGRSSTRAGVRPRRRSSHPPSSWRGPRLPATSTRSTPSRKGRLTRSLEQAGQQAAPRRQADPRQVGDRQPAGQRRGPGQHVAAALVGRPAVDDQAVGHVEEGVAGRRQAGRQPHHQGDVGQGEGPHDGVEVVAGRAPDEQARPPRSTPPARRARGRAPRGRRRRRCRRGRLDASGSPFSSTTTRVRDGWRTPRSWMMPRTRSASAWLWVTATRVSTLARTAARCSWRRRSDRARSTWPMETLSASHEPMVVEVVRRCRAPTGAARVTGGASRGRRGGGARRPPPGPTCRPRSGPGARRPPRTPPAPGRRYARPGPPRRSG